jgi:predicted regulator of Ras-like GTPase activity (Roadblock/LC7/MglB family)
LSTTLESLNEALEELNQTGRVIASLVATDEGFVIASVVSKDVDENVAAAMSSFVHNAAQRAREELKLGQIRDITIRCDKGTLVCKGATLNDGRQVVLAALVDRKTRFFMRAVNNAVRKIQELLRDLYA